jgi:uncharacterized protein YndB with AHSA1/START domain
MSEQAESITVSKAVSVNAPPERAFAVFTGGFGRWWPLSSHHVGSQPAVDAILEPLAGGRWFERAADGSECDWGRVLAWDPPRRVVLSWELNGDFKHDPDVASEVEVTFAPEGEGATRVELVHRGLEVYGEQADRMREVFGSDGGWTGLLETFAAEAGR